MKKIRLVIFYLFAALSALFVSGCALLNTALSAAAAYGIYQATR